MGKVMTKVKLTNREDELLASSGLLPPERVRRMEIEAPVDTGATMVVLPADVCRALGVRELGRRWVRYADGRRREVPWVGDLFIEILERQMMCEALVEAEGTMPLIGQIPMEALNLLVNPKTGELMPDPESPDAPLLDILRVA